MDVIRSFLRPSAPPNLHAGCPECARAARSATEQELFQRVQQNPCFQQWIEEMLGSNRELDELRDRVRAVEMLDNDNRTKALQIHGLIQERDKLEARIDVLEARVEMYSQMAPSLTKSAPPQVLAPLLEEAPIPEERTKVAIVQARKLREDRDRMKVELEVLGKELEEVRARSDLALFQASQKSKEEERVRLNTSAAMGNLSDDLASEQGKNKRLQVQLAEKNLVLDEADKERKIFLAFIQTLSQEEQLRFKGFYEKRKG